MNKKEKLTLLGAWDEPPLMTWSWFADKAVNHFAKLSGVRFGILTYLKDDLHYQYFTKRSTEQLHRKFGKMTKRRKLNYVKKICCDYYKNAEKTKHFLTFLETANFGKLDNNQLIKIMVRWSNIVPMTAMQIWFVVLLDIWYPEPEKERGVKMIGAKARDHSGHLHEKLEKQLGRFCVVASKRLKITSQEIKYLFPEEIIAVLKNKKPTFHIEGRKKLFVTLNESNKYCIYEQGKAKSVLRKYEIAGLKKKNIFELKGQTVSPGIIKGKVRKVFLKSQFNKFKKGEILVALQTMVDYVSIMKKAKAILTELGGLTSHAAIISRELKKPCIVGIQGLTSILKDGDLVEVDANQGIVKILKKS